MDTVSQSDSLLIQRIRDGESEAWNVLIDRFEGRLLAYAQSRLHDKAAAEDVVQETFMGFLTSLPNYNQRQPLEGYLFSIAAHKLTDLLRREGRRPSLPLLSRGTSDGGGEPPAKGRAASSIVRSDERRTLETEALGAAIAAQLESWREQGLWQKIQCAELLFVRGWPNKEAASRLGISEQTVANCKYEFLAKLRAAVRQQALPEDIFPELYEKSGD
jgi:RNA polymerase sigma-70 factor, ECF subfamily